MKGQVIGDKPECSRGPGVNCALARWQLKPLAPLVVSRGLGFPPLREWQSRIRACELMIDNLRLMIEFM